VESVVRKLRGSVDRLGEALMSLLQAQALLVQNQSRVDARFAEIERILLRHEAILNDLPEAIRRKIGYRPPSDSQAAP
jgi:hypothetical protein